MFGVFAIDEPGSSVRALYATLVRSSYFDWNEVFLTGAENKIVTLYSFKSAAFDVAMEDMLTSSHIEQGNQMISTT